MRLWRTLPFFVCMALSVLPARAAEIGLTYQTFASWGGSPQLPDGSQQPLSSGGIDAINFDWGGGPVLDSGRSDGVIVRFDGWLSPPTTDTYYLCGLVDDGFLLYLDGVLVIDDWWDKGPSCGSTADVDFSNGEPKALTAWMYENGGGAVAILLFYANDQTWQPVPSSWYTNQPTQTTTTTTESTTTTVESTTTTLLEETTTTVEDTTTVPSPETSTIPDATVPETTNPPQPPVVIPPQPEETWPPETTTPETTDPATSDNQTDSSDATTPDTSMTEESTANPSEPPSSEFTEPQSTDSASMGPIESVSTATPTQTDVSPSEPPTTTTSVPGEAEVIAPPNDAPEAAKRAFEAQVNVFDGTHDDYVPAGSTITVAQRRTLVAATVTMNNILPIGPSRRKK